MDHLLAKLIKGLERQESCLKEIKANILELSQKVEESHTTTVQQLEEQFGQMSTTLNQCQLATFPSNTIQNTKNNSHYIAITTQSDKATFDLAVPLVDNKRIDHMSINDVDKDKIEKLVMNDDVSQNPIVAKKKLILTEKWVRKSHQY